MNFGEALAHIKQEKKVARRNWNGKNMYIFIIPGWGYGKATNNLPFIAMKTVDDHVVPWLASQTDILSTDWILVD
jgi:hypothetical protein